jgi:hypothetical protein
VANCNELSPGETGVLFLNLCNNAFSTAYAPRLASNGKMIVNDD